MSWVIAEVAERTEPGVWVGATEPGVLLATLGDDMWCPVGQVARPCTIGSVVDWPLVEMPHGRLRSTTDQGLELGGNLAWVAGEVLAFGDAILTRAAERARAGEPDADLDRLGRLRRGLRGTAEREIRPGAQLLVLDLAAAFVPLGPALLAHGARLVWRFVPEGESVSDHRSRPFPVTGISAPRLDGTRPSVRGCAASEPEKPLWGDRWVVGYMGADAAAGWGGWPVGAVVAWVDRWHREPIEPGAAVWDLDLGREIRWTGRAWRVS